MVNHDIDFGCFVYKKKKRKQSYLGNSDKVLGYSLLESSGIKDSINAHMDFMSNMREYQTKERPGRIM